MATVLLQPDPSLVARVGARGGGDLKRCFQCATCAVVCDLSPTERPFPRKEMLWAQWGLGDRLAGDPDLWLCHQCGDCSSRCPRGARPGDVMGALRQEVIEHHAPLRPLARWADEPWFLALILVFPVVVLLLAAWIFQAGGAGEPIVFPTWNRLPRGVLVALFGTVALLDGLVLAVGVRRFWRALPPLTRGSPARSLGPTLLSVLRHDSFDRCVAEKPRKTSHMLVLFGMVALVAVDLVVLAAPWSPTPFAYPFAYWNPWKILANGAGLAVLAGLGLMAWERLKRIPVGGDRTAPGVGSRGDWVLLALLATVVGTGFVTEILHALRWDVWRQASYVLHLAPTFALLVLLPTSKLAHVLYRTTALVWAHAAGRLPPPREAP